MGLFSNDSLAEKRLKELTGGSLLSISFMNMLESNGLEISDGTEIRNQLKREIKEGRVNAYNIEARLTQLINQRSEGSVVNHKPSSQPISKKKCPKCGKVQDAKYDFCTGCGYRFYTNTKSPKECPKCGKLQEGNNAFCINCGYKFSIERSKTKKPKKSNQSNLGKNAFVICPNCELEQSRLNKTCEYCGFDFERRMMPDDFIICPNCNRAVKKLTKICPVCKFDFIRNNTPENLDEIRKIKLLSSNEFNLKTCPDCNTKFFKTDPFCFNCGSTVLTQDTVKNNNLKVKDGKLVAKDETNNDELLELEALYSQTVQSKYSPQFKIGYVLFLSEFQKNPTKKFSDKLAKQYDTTANKLKKQALEDEFIELAPVICEAQNLKVTELKEILKKHNLKVSGTKEDLIKRLDENLTEDDLKKYFKSKNYQISEKGIEFLAKNNYIVYIEKNRDIASVVYPSEIIKIFEEKEYSIEEIQDILLKYLSKVFDEKLTQELWVDFKDYANAIAFIAEEKNNLKEALNMRFKVYLFDVNNFSVVLGRPDPARTKLKQKDLSKLLDLLHQLGLSIDELKELFNQSFDEVLFKTTISKEDSLIYLLKIFGGEDLDKISEEINDSYSNPY